MVYLVGAGPGDPGLMTCRGAEVLRECEAVVYDRLGTSGLLELVPEDCEKIYVGKKPGSHSKKQEEINEILIDTAKRFDRVVRLKGGASRMPHPAGSHRSIPAAPRGSNQGRRV